jgi:predicted CoA-binding protein
MKSIEQKKIAIVGVSEDVNKYGHKIFKDMLKEGLAVVGVNPKDGEILGRKIYKSIKDLPECPDIVVTAVPPAVTETIVDECHDAGINEIWMQPGSESEQAVRTAKKYGMQVTYNACIMVQNGIW